MASIWTQQPKISHDTLYDSIEDNNFPTLGVYVYNIYLKQPSILDPPIGHVLPVKL